VEVLAFQDSTISLDVVVIEIAKLKAKGGICGLVAGMITCLIFKFWV